MHGISIGQRSKIAASGTRVEGVCTAGLDYQTTRAPESGNLAVGRARPSKSGWHWSASEAVVWSDQSRSVQSPANRSNQRHRGWAIGPHQWRCQSRPNWATLRTDALMIRYWHLHKLQDKALEVISRAPPRHQSRGTAGTQITSSLSPSYLSVKYYKQKQKCKSIIELVSYWL